MIAAGAGIAALSWRQPWFADDYAYAAPLAQHPGILDFVLHWYHAWSGRATSTAFIWLAETHRPLFALTVAAAFILSACLAVVVGLGELPKWDHRTLVLSSLALVVMWFAMPAHGEVAVWLTGSSTYLLTIPLVLGFLLPYRIALNPTAGPVPLGRGLLISVPMAVLGFAVGMSQESAVAGVAVVLVLVLVIATRRRIVRRLPVYLWAGALGLVAGGVLLVGGQMTALASQSDRAPALVGGASGALTRVAYFALVLGKGLSFVLPAIIPWLLVVILLALPRSTREDEKPTSFKALLLWPAVWFAAATGTLLPFAVVPYPGGGRIYAFGFVFLMLGAFSLFASTEAAELDVLPQRWVSIAAAVLLGVLLAEIGSSLLVQQRLRTELAHREQLIAAQVAQGRTDLTVPRLVILPHRTVPYNDITRDPANWRNVAVAKWFGVRTIRLDDSLPPE